MRKLLLLFGMLWSLGAGAVDTKWFEEARYGMFIHYGPYAVLGNGEWVMYSRSINRDIYKAHLQQFFNPEKFDAKAWVKTAKDAGMKYIVITSRHHDGFSMWNTAQSDWNIMNTPYGKDILRQLADECRAQGVKLGFYYSLLDWSRDDYSWRTGRRSPQLGRTAPNDWEHYIAFMKAQLTELLTNYGDIAIIWFDGHWDQTVNNTDNDPNTKIDWHYPEIYGLIKKLQPNCLVANNHHTTMHPGEDYQIFERDLPGENHAGYGGAEVSRMPLETCEPISGAWGYNITDNSVKSKRQIVHLLVRSAGYGSNLLLNVGPFPDGRINPLHVERLAEAGQWLQKYGHTVYGTSAGPIKPRQWGAVTKKGNKVYVHILDGSDNAISLEIPGFKSAKLLTGGEKLATSYANGILTIKTPENLDPIDTIIEVTTKN